MYGPATVAGSYRRQHTELGAAAWPLSQLDISHMLEPRQTIRRCTLADCASVGRILHKGWRVPGGPSSTLHAQPVSRAANLLARVS